MCCLQNPNRPLSLVLLGSRRGWVQLLILNLRISTHTPHYRTRNFTEVEYSWTLDGFVSYAMMYVDITNKSKVFVASCSLGPVNIMSLIQWTSVILCGRDKWSRSFQVKTQSSRELMYPWEVGQWKCIAGLASQKQITSCGPYGQIFFKKVFVR